MHLAGLSLLADFSPMRELRKTVTTPYHPAANLDSPERMAALLDAAHKDGHPIIIAAALGAIAVAKNLSPTE